MGDPEVIEVREGEEVLYTEQDVVGALHEGNAAVLDAWYRQQFREADKTLDGRLGLEQKKAELLHIAGKDDDARQVLKDAIALAEAAGAAEMKLLMEKRLLQLGGTPISPQDRERRALRARNNEVQRELVALQAHDSAEAKKLGPEATAARVNELKRELQELIDREAVIH